MPDLEHQTPYTTNFERPKVLLAIMAFILPPLPIFLMTAPNYTIFTKEVLISFLLTIFGHIPGIIFSLYVIFTKDQNNELYTRVEDFLNRHDHSDGLAHHHHNHHNHADHGATDNPEGIGANATLAASDSVGATAFEPYTDAEVPKEDPPHYTEVGGSSKGPAPTDSKGSDHKVQK